MKSLFLFGALSIFQVLCCHDENSIFFNIKQNLRHVGAAFKQSLVDSFLICGFECVQERECVSFNYQKKGEGEQNRMCQLNRQATTSSSFVYDDNYDYGEIEQNCFSTCIDGRRPAKNCAELKAQGCPDGDYCIDPDERGKIKVFCDQTTDGGGWTVFQRRFSTFETNFSRTWVEYQLGFGDTSGEFWLGNDYIHRLTAAAPSELRIDLMASGDHKGFAKYTEFEVASGADKYQWNMTSYSGNIGNSLYGWSHAPHNQRGMKFSTPDQDNDERPDRNCDNNSGWWYNWCGQANLNAMTIPFWKTWAYKDTIIRSEMKLR